MTRARGPKFDVPFRRRKEKKTDYRKRAALLKSNLPRMVVRKTNRQVIVQFFEFSPRGDNCLVSVDAVRLKKISGWEMKCNSWSAYLAGLLAGKEALKKGIKDFVLDIGRQTPTKGSIVFAALKGAVDAGLQTKFSEEVIPLDKLENIPEKIKGMFEEAKNKIAA
ncbi:MAG: 50S ribosomal protein L18 [Candidatus Bilamarchaeaceae archaeon]